MDVLFNGNSNETDIAKHYCNWKISMCTMDNGDIWYWDTLACFMCPNYHISLINLHPGVVHALE